MYSPVLEFKSSLTRLKSKCWQECFLLEALKEVCISLPFSVSRNHLYFMASGLLLSFFIFKANPSLLYFFHFLSLSHTHTHNLTSTSPSVTLTLLPPSCWVHPEYLLKLSIFNSVTSAKPLCHDVPVGRYAVLFSLTFNFGDCYSQIL